MISDTTPHHRPNDASAFRCAAATALFLGALLGASMALAAGDATDNHPATGAPGDKASAPPAGNADLKTCDKGLVWDAKKKKCLAKHGGVLPDAELTEYAYALAKAERYQEALDILDMLENPNTPRALNYRGYATRKLGRTDEGIGYYLKSVALDPAYPQVREYLGEAYVIEGKLDLARDQLSAIEKLCGSKECEYYADLSEAISKAGRL